MPAILWLPSSEPCAGTGLLSRSLGQRPKPGALCGPVTTLALAAIAFIPAGICPAATLAKSITVGWPWLTCSPQPQ